ncbi:SMC-Scp complex subunit ScpB [Candidatus Parcubacteria bacterium]|nr:MAG: SMC-Scp complex subunit ScpB [Candidatus Parcubacteria bacterium]
MTEFAEHATAGFGDRLARLEALLFIHGEPLSKKKICDVLGVSREEAENLLEKLGAELSLSGRGIQLAALGEKVQLVTKPEFGKLLEDFAKEELSEELTPASLEALAIIAYLGPISRNRLEYLRGVNSIFILRNLRLRGLVERVPDPENASSYLYEPSFDLVKHLGVTRKEDLPDYERLRSLLKKAETEPEAAESVAVERQ